MPLVTVKLVREDALSADKKAELIANLTRAMAQTLDKPESAMWVVIEQVSSDDWGVGGESLTQRRSRKN